MGRTAIREVVCPCSGDKFASVYDAARAMTADGFRADPGGIADAIEFGLPYCGRYFDWRFPPDWTKSRRRAAERTKQEAHA